MQRMAALNGLVALVGSETALLQVVHLKISHATLIILIVWWVISEE